MKRVSFKAAVSLKELGFNEGCDAYYHIYDDIADCENSLELLEKKDFFNDKNKYRVAAPSIKQVIEWLENLHGK